MGILNLNTCVKEDKNRLVYSAVAIIGIGNNKREFQDFIKRSSIEVKLVHLFLTF